MHIVQRRMIEPLQNSGLEKMRNELVVVLLEVQ